MCMQKNVSLCVKNTQNTYKVYLITYKDKMHFVNTVLRKFILFCYGCKNGQFGEIMYPDR